MIEVTFMTDDNGPEWANDPNVREGIRRWGDELSRLIDEAIWRSVALQRPLDDTFREVLDEQQ